MLGSRRRRDPCADLPGIDDAETKFMEPAGPEHAAIEMVKPTVPEGVVEQDLIC